MIFMIQSDTNLRKENHMTHCTPPMGGLYAIALFEPIERNSAAYVCESDHGRCQFPTVRTRKVPLKSHFPF